MTSNKIRGPVAREQPQKIGEYSLETIDHIYYSEGLEPTLPDLALPLELKLSSSEIEQLVENAKLSSPEALLASVRESDPSICVPEVLARGIPDATVPSDHYPVVQDFRFVPQPTQPTLPRT